MRKGGFIPIWLLKAGWGVFKGVPFFIIGLTVPTQKRGGTGDVLGDWAANSLCWSSLQSPRWRENDRMVFPIKSWELSNSISHWSPSDKVLSWSPQPSGIQTRPKLSYHWHHWGLVQGCHWSYLNNNKKKTQMKKKGRWKQQQKMDQILLREIKVVKIKSHFVVKL